MVVVVVPSRWQVVGLGGVVEVQLPLQLGPVDVLKRYFCVVYSL